jgi:murein DD-endopeptidase MepM/ murein hydrolase activator NlpD
VDLKVGETQEVVLADGTKATVKLIGTEADRDSLRGAVRSARARVEVNGEAVALEAANYALPVPAGGVQADCPITRDTYGTSNRDRWGLAKDARIRLWPAGSPWIASDTFTYPARQRWFATDTQMCNEPTFVDGGETPNPKVYYHSGLDIGGSEGMVDIVAATDGVVLSAGKQAAPDVEGTPVAPRYDVIYIRDDRGWYYRYSHLKSIDPAVLPGKPVARGQTIGVLGKEGASGGWSHLHFEILSRQPSGKWGTEEGYAFFWQAYVAEHKPKLLAVARPHKVALVGETVALDGGKSRAFGTGPLAFAWTLSDGRTVASARASIAYTQPGSYSEVLKVTDAKGHTAWDFCVVQIADKANPKRVPPSLHANYAPTFGIRPGQPVTFKVRTFRAAGGDESWNFGDGSPVVQTNSKGGYAETVHRYAKPGDYLVRVLRTSENGLIGMARLHVRVE